MEISPNIVLIKINWSNAQVWLIVSEILRNIIKVIKIEDIYFAQIFPNIILAQFDKF